MKRHFRSGMADYLYIILSLIILSALWSVPCLAKEGSCFADSSTQYRENLKMNTEFALKPQSNYELDFCSNEKIDSTKLADDFNDKFYTYKNPGITLGLALVPGFVIHGFGHYYIEKPVMGTALLLIEIGSFFMVASQIDFGENSGRKSNYDITDLGTFLFYGSWAYDFIASPIIANKMNKQHQAAFYLSPGIQRNVACVNLAMTW
jgi:hypothetical protein